MGFDVFRLRERVVGEYRDYFRSFVHVLDPRIRRFVNELIEDGELWPEAVLQLNPAYEAGPTLGELAAEGTIAAETARFFGETLRLHRHQHEALIAAKTGEPYVVSTGTGSGKTLTYLVPMVDHVLRNEPARHSVRAVIVYPMNALINSQVEALEEFRRRNWPDCPVRFAAYTGQTRDDVRNQILGDAPHILLTNYVMLEYMLIRPTERTLVEQMTRDLRFLALDELHVYRGRQGADVSMLARRLRQRAGSPDLQCVGTSATLVTGGGREERRRAIAQVGTKLFGMPVRPEHVIDETLQRVTRAEPPATGECLRAAVMAPPPELAADAVINHPLAAWVETTFGIEVEGERLVRRRPIAFEEGLRRLVAESGVGEALCRERLTAVLEAGNTVGRKSDGEPVFAFRLHQFLSSGGSIYATLEPPERRELTTEAEYVIAGEDGGSRRVLFPLAFCRECGQEHYLANRIEERGARRLVPRSPLLNASNDDIEGETGFFALERDGLWSEDEDLPDGWYEYRGGEWRIRKNYRELVPQAMMVAADGSIGDGGTEGWWQGAPLLICLRCRTSYDSRTSDFRKLVTLSQTGRSTATTILSAAAVLELRADGAVPQGAQKLLSFTDNRQDASLQAGHLNDFAQVALLRGALVRALEVEGTLTFDRIGRAIFDALAPAPAHFMQEPASSGPARRRAEGVMVDLLEYRTFEDLARAWRIAQPNLEQCGLLQIDYADLDELTKDEVRWTGIPQFAEAPPERRAAVIRAILDYMRGVLAIDALPLTERRLQSLVRRVHQAIRDPWTFDEHDRPRGATLVLLPNVSPDEGDHRIALRLGRRAAITRFLRSRRTWDLERDLNGATGEAIANSLVEALRGELFTVVEQRGRPYGVQLRVDRILWRKGDGRPSRPDPVRSRSLHLVRDDLVAKAPNTYFRRLYQERVQALAGLLSAEHTGQVRPTDRIEREEAFREGQLPILYCSPTMELGIDIRDLAVVHMRNIPPTPANYAQRSGRAGRGGRPALVLAFSSYGNVHDQHFFRHRSDMIAGVVVPPRIDLGNRELVESHLHSVWLADVRLSLGSRVDDVLELGAEGMPLKEDVQVKTAAVGANLESITAACRTIVAMVGDEVNKTSWYSDGWLEQTVRGAAKAFNDAFDRWRELYRAAVEQRDRARAIIDSNPRDRRAREEAERRQREAQREIDLLLNRTGGTEADFYSYRYLGSEGFIPGYNFPRLPLRALVPRRDETHAIDRPRFLGLAEFGPRNVIYFEGRKHRISGCVLPAGDLIERMRSAKLCSECGHAHPDDGPTTDLCEFCGAPLNGDTMALPQRLLPLSTVRAQRWERISSEEEERAREGYDITTHFRAPPSGSTAELRYHDTSQDEAQPLAVLRALPQAQLWRINNGWRRSRERNGFVIDGTTGRWHRRADLPDDEPDEPNGAAPLAGVRPYVRDTRNILLLRPNVPTGEEEAFFRSLAHALRRALQLHYQVEEQEIAVELIGRGTQRRILLWEAAEGGIGMWERLMENRAALPSLAKAALEIIHCDPDTGEDREDDDKACAAACYDCLLSYVNQPDHRYLDRTQIRDYLLALSRAEAAQEPGGRSYSDHFAWLRERIDSESSFERALLDHLYRSRMALPDRAQHCPAPDVAVQVDFFYERPDALGICVFVDGPHHDAPEHAARDREVREALEDRGFRVIAITHERPITDQVQEYPDVFGTTEGHNLASSTINPSQH